MRWLASSARLPRSGVPDRVSAEFPAESCRLRPSAKRYKIVRSRLLSLPTPVAIFRAASRAAGVKTACRVRRFRITDRPRKSRS
jgi:hypothetical protein